MPHYSIDVSRGPEADLAGPAVSAIKVFGYLEKPVFHELARHLQTRRLLAGDTLNLDSDKSFYIVVDGSVQVFAQTGSPAKARDAYDDEDDNGYQLLNNVENGGTLSSLFTILSLFTEDVKLRYEEDGEGSRGTTAAEDRADRSRTTSYDSPPASRASSRRRPPPAGPRDPDVSDFNLDAHNRNHTAAAASSSTATHYTKTPRPLSGASFASSSGATLRHEGASDSTEPASPSFYPLDSMSPPRRLAGQHPVPVILPGHRPPSKEPRADRRQSHARIRRKRAPLPGPPSTRPWP